MLMHSLQQQTGKHKPKLLPDCPLKIANINDNKCNKMLNLSVNIKRERNRINNRPTRKQKMHENLKLADDVCSFCAQTKEFKILFHEYKKSESVPNLKICDENFKNSYYLTPTHRNINMPTLTTNVIATSGQSKPYTCFLLKRLKKTNAEFITTNIFNQTKLLSSNLKSNKSKNLLHINYGQEKLVYTSIKNGNNDKISKEGKTTQSGKTSTRLISTTTTRTTAQHLKTQQSLATRLKNLLISFKICNKVGMAPITCLLIMIFFLSTHSQIVTSQDMKTAAEAAKTTKNLLMNYHKMDFNNHMTAITNMNKIMAINLSHSNHVTNNDDAKLSKKSKLNNLLKKTNKIENYDEYKILSKNTPYELLLKNQIISKSMGKISTRHNYHDHIKQMRPVIEYLNSGEVEEYDAATDESSADTDIKSDNSSKDNSLDNGMHDISSDEMPRMKPVISQADNQKLLKLVIDGLGLKQLPDMRKANISQQEYASKYKEYVERLKVRELRENAGIHPSLRSPLTDPLLAAPIQFLTITPNITLLEQYRSRQRRDVALAGTYTDNHLKSGKSNDKNSVLLHFPINVDVSQLHPDDIEEANIKFMIIHNAALAHKTHANKRPRHEKEGKSGDTQKHVINLKVYELTREKRIWLAGRKLEIEVDRNKADQTYNQWLELDVTKAVSKWLHSPDDNLGLEIQCSNCHRLGARILNHASDAPGKENVDFQLNPVLNIIGRRSQKAHEMHPHQLQSRDSASNKHYNHISGRTETAGKTDCHKDKKRCCRHTMEVVFKEIKGYEFILQPKVFDAGFCRGRCPALYRTANHHAILQSLIYQQDPSKAPRPCCAPSKMVELEILHVDENDPDKLKISTWNDMRVVECACT